MAEPQPAATPRPVADPRRRLMAPVVLLGLVGAGLAALAGHHPWVHLHGSGGSGAGSDSAYSSSLDLTFSIVTRDAPAVGGLALVALACWGVLLVTRGKVRRAMAVLAAISAVCVLVAAGQALGNVKGDYAGELRTAGITSPHVGWTAWPWLALLGGAIALVAAGLAFRLAPGWPEMGARYDAPTGGGGGPAPTAAVDEQSNLDLWKSMDAGHDPTTATPGETAE